MSIKFGADPEVFATYLKGDEKFVLPPAYFRKFLGLAFEPDPRHPKFLNEDGILIHEDGAAFEFSVPASDSISELLRTIHHGYDLLQNKILKNFKDISMEVVPTVNYEVDRWLQYEEDHDFFLSFMFGCDPHLLAWEPEKEDEPVDAARHPYRYGGGHIHFSGLPIFEENPILAIRTLDMTVGLAATAFSPVPKLEEIRTFRYGQAGVFRPQHYPDGSVGIEYRSVSNSWTNPKNTELASNIEKWAMIAIENLLPNPSKAEKLIMDVKSDLIKAISTSDQNLANNVLAFVEGSI